MIVIPVQSLGASPAEMLNTANSTASDVMAKIAAAQAAIAQGAQTVQTLIDPATGRQVTVPVTATPVAVAPLPQAEADNSGSFPWVQAGGAGIGALIGHHFGGIIGALVGAGAGYFAAGFVKGE